MERIRAWWADAQVWLAAASPRERRMILLGRGRRAAVIVLIRLRELLFRDRAAETRWRKSGPIREDLTAGRG